MSRSIPTVDAISVIAGVAKSTVSRALKGDSRISKATRDRIVEIAKSVGYMPNAMARGLTTARNGLVGFVLSEAQNYYYQEHIQQLTGLAARRGYTLVLFQVTAAGDFIDVIPKMLQYRLDGCILVASAPVSTEAIEMCRQFHMPVVVLNRTAPATSASSVLCNNFIGGKQIAELLVEAGHRRIALVAGRPDSAVAEERERGFLAGLKNAGGVLFAREQGFWTFESGYAAMQKFLAGDKRPDAVCAVGDIMAFGVCDALRQAGLQKPDDVSVVGFDNSRVCDWPAYDLTSYAQPLDQMLNRALDIIDDGRSSGRQAESTFIDGELIVRGSMRLPPDFHRRRDVTNLSNQPGVSP